MPPDSYYCSRFSWVTVGSGSKLLCHSYCLLCCLTRSLCYRSLRCNASWLSLTGSLPGQIPSHRSNHPVYAWMLNLPRQRLWPALGGCGPRPTPAVSGSPPAMAHDLGSLTATCVHLPYSFLLLFHKARFPSPGTLRRDCEIIKCLKLKAAVF